jgi:hypothetical protein
MLCLDEESSSESTVEICKMDINTSPPETYAPSQRMDMLLPGTSHYMVLDAHVIGTQVFDSGKESSTVSALVTRDALEHKRLSE